MYIDPDIQTKITKEVQAEQKDLSLFIEDKWLQNSEVKYLVYPRNGRWFVDMLFIALETPMKIIVRKIDHYHSRKKAETFASIFQRGIRKDARGTLKRQEYAYNICKN